MKKFDLTKIKDIEKAIEWAKNEIAEYENFIAMCRKRMEREYSRELWKPIDAIIRKKKIK